MAPLLDGYIEEAENEEPRARAQNIFDRRAPTRTFGTLSLRTGHLIESKGNGIKLITQRRSKEVLPSPRNEEKNVITNKLSDLADGAHCS